MSELGSKAPLRPWVSHFRSSPINGHHQTGPVGPVRANNGSHKSHSITSSACASIVAGTSTPSAFAVLRLMASSYLVGC